MKGQRMVSGFIKLDEELTSKQVAKGMLLHDRVKFLSLCRTIMTSCSLERQSIPYGKDESNYINLLSLCASDSVCLGLCTSDVARILRYVLFPVLHKLVLM